MSVESTQPTISVCVTTYQHKPFIRACLESVLSQSFKGTLELLVGDDGSTDGTQDIINNIADQHPHQLRVFFHTSNLGPSGNLSYLVQQAKGLFIGHLDGDDLWLPGKLNAQLTMLQNSHNLSAVYSNAYVIDSDNRKLGLFNHKMPSVIKLHELVRRGNFLNHSSLLYRSTARNALLYMDIPYIDYRLHIRLLHHGDLGYINLPFVGYRWRTSTSMITSMPKLVHEGHLDVFHEMVNTGAEFTDIHSAISRFWGKLFLQAIINYQWRYLNEWRLRLLNDPILRFSPKDMVIATLMTFPRAFSSFWRRKVTNRTNAVYFP